MFKGDNFQSNTRACYADQHVSHLHFFVFKLTDASYCFKVWIDQHVSYAQV